MLTDNWHELSPEEKFEERFNAWRSPPGVEFASPEVEQGYKRRVQMIKDVVELKKPERVPVCPWIGFYPAKYAGVTVEELMHDYDKLGMVWQKFFTDFMPDALGSSFLIGSAKIFEILDYKLYKWAGHGAPPDSPYQCIEDEYMQADEYDWLIADPSDYFRRCYLPRIFGALTSWQKLSPFTDILELPFVGAFVIPLGLPDVQQAYQSLLEAGRAALEWVTAFSAVDGAAIATLGLPILMGGITKAPFDTMGDTLRGTRAIMLDMFRRPEKLLAAVERLVPIAVEMGVRTATIGRNPMVFIPLHKGADGFMSNADFERFYWPTLKAVILGLINEGLVPFLFAEGGYNQRLDIITDSDIPAGKIVWMFDQTDMVDAKAKLGGWACFGGNVPLAMLKAGTPEQVRDYVKNLIENVAQDGGFILSTGAVLDDAEPENLHALIEAGKEYGVY